MKDPTSDKYGKDYWFKFRDDIYEVGKPNFSIVSNGQDEHPDPDLIRISDCKFSVFIDVSCGSNRQDALERAQALCKVLNADYPFLDSEYHRSKEYESMKHPDLLYRPDNTSDYPKLKRCDPPMYVKFSNDVFLMKSYLDQHKIEYKLEDLENGPMGLVLRIKRDSLNE